MIIGRSQTRHLRRSRTATDSACAVSPSAVARSMTRRPMRRSPARRQALHGDLADEVGGRQAAADARGAGGRQHVVRADRVVAGDLRRPRADEQRAGAPHLRRHAGHRPRPDARAPRRWPESIASAIERVTMMPPCARSEARAGPSPASRASTCAATRVGERAARRDQHRARVGVVLGLRDQIGGDPRRRPARRDDDDLGRAGVEVDAAVGGDQRLGGGDVAVAGPDDLVDARHRPRCRRRAPRSRARRRRGTGATRRPRAPPPCTTGVRPRADGDDLADAGRRAPESRSSAATRAADSVRRARSSRRDRAARRAARR